MVVYTDTEATTDRTRVVLCDSHGSWAPRPLDWQAEAEELARTVSGGSAGISSPTPNAAPGTGCCSYRPPPVTR